LIKARQSRVDEESKNSVALNNSKQDVESATALAGAVRPWSADINCYIEGFDKAIEDDLNTPRALAELWGLLREGPATKQALEAVFDMDRVLGLGLEDAVRDSGGDQNEALSQEIGELIAKRAEAKKAKDFTAADNIRQNLKDRGIILEDGPSGTSWRSI
ncbi:MAG: hypothetical protein FWD22_01880, partial [Treponema sp.]|nr:hypothetical protein [Treponema sp.]